jgi:hypothetical protein
MTARAAPGLGSSHTFDAVNWLNNDAQVRKAKGIALAQQSGQLQPFITVFPLRSAWASSHLLGRTPFSGHLRAPQDPDSRLAAQPVSILGELIGLHQV